MRIVTAVFLVVAVIALGGCSKKMTFQNKEGGTTTVEQSGVGTNKSVTVTNKEGTATFGKNAVDLNKLGVPVYPGATAKDTGGFSATSKEGSAQIIVLTTTDPFDKVYDWYKSQMPAGSETMKMSTGGGQLASFQIGKSSDKIAKGVMITGSKDKTTITLSSGTKP